MDKQAIESRIRSIAEAAAADNGVELVHTEFAGAKKSLTLRIYIDKPGGVSIEDCTAVSHSVEAALDADDFIPDPYLLEVSSPGLERGLYSEADFAKFAGSKAKVRTSEPIGGQSNFSGRIVSVADGEVAFEDKTSGLVTIPYASVAKANLRVDLSEEFKKKR